MQSEKIESVGRLAGGIAHDFNNLLTAILGYTELLISHRAAADPDRADLEEIQKAGQRAASLTQQLLAFSRKQVLMPKDVDLNQTVAELKSMLTRLIREDITLSCELADQPATVRIDPAQIEQAILNLVLNARDALPAGGHIRLEVACVRRSQVDVPSDLQSMAGDYVRLRVVDDGVGIAPEARAHLFEPFFTTKDIGKGTGLGLASVYGIVRQSNGFIAVESQPGRGTAFTMHFPSVSRTDEVPRPAVDAPGPTSGRETILLVEDEDAVRVIVSAVLRRQGYRVLEASSPSGACVIFERHAAEIDLLLTDVVMPEMNGPTLAQRLVSLRPELRILFISGYADMTTPPASGNPNVSFLSKPFQASVLSERVRQMLARPGRLQTTP
jgi:CheY-like chemotaxis protein